MDTLTEALGFSLAPGGKGLKQAVAAARLGLEVALVAAVGLMIGSATRSSIICRMSGSIPHC